MNVAIEFIHLIKNWDEAMHGPVPDFYNLIHDQIPRKLHGKVDVYIQSDAFHMCTKVIFTLKDRPEFKHEAYLEDLPVGGRMIALKIPQETLAWMGLFFV